MNKHKFEIGDMVTYENKNYYVVRIIGHWFGTCTYDIKSIASKTADERIIKDVPENFLKKVETVSRKFQSV